MKTRYLAILGGLIATVAALILAGTALAQSPTPAPNKPGDGYQDTYLNRLAAALGVSREKLDGAFTQARNETLDQAVKDGKLTKEQADKMKAQQPRGPMFGFWGGQAKPKQPRGMGPAVAPKQPHDAIAKALGITPEELTNQIRSGKTLKELAQGKEQAVKDAILKAEKERLDQAVKDGKLSQDQANKIYERLQKADPLSMFGGARGHGRHFGPGWFSGPGGKPKAQPTPSGSGGS